MERRELLKRVGVAGAAGTVVAGAYVTTRGDSEPPPGTPTDTETATEPPDTDTAAPSPTAETPYAGDFETVVDAVEAGADPSGEEPVNFLFEDVDDSTLLAFEPGRYRLDYFSVSDVSGIGVVGTGEERSTFLPVEGECRGGHPWVFFEDVSDFLLENVTFDFRETTGGGPIHLLLGGDSVVRDVTHVGSCSNQLSGLRVGVRTEGGTALFENFQARNTDDNQSLTGVYVEEEHAGELTFENCELRAFSDNGLYASAPGLSDGRDGTVNVVGGTYRNNNIAGVRLGSTGSRATDVSVTIDDSEIPGWGELNARGIRLRNRSEQVIKNCDITFGPDAPESFGGIVFHPKNGGATVVDTTITVERDSIPAIMAFPPEPESQGAATFRNVTVEGGAAEGVAVDIRGRENTVFENCTIEQTGEKRDGIKFRGSGNSRIVDSRFDVTGAPVTVSGGSVKIENCTVVTPEGEQEITSTTVENGRLQVD